MMWDVLPQQVSCSLYFGFVLVLTANFIVRKIDEDNALF